MKKRILSMLLVIVMVLSLVPVSALAADELKIVSTKSSKYVVIDDDLITLSATDTGGTPITSGKLIFEFEPADHITVVSTTDTTCTIKGAKQGEVIAKVRAETSGRTGTKPLTVILPPENLQIVKPMTTEAVDSNLKVGNPVELSYTCSNIDKIESALIVTSWKVKNESEPGVLTVSDAGVLTAGKVGTAEVRLAVNGRSVSQQFTVSPADPGEITVSKSAESVKVGETVILTVSIGDDASIPAKNYTFSVDSSSTGNVDFSRSQTSNRCTVTGNKAGAVKINVTYTDGDKDYAGSIDLVVDPLSEMSITADRDEMYPNRTLTLTASVDGVKWTSGDTSIATVDETTGEVSSSSKLGPVTITATKPGFKDATYVITVVPNSFRITDASGKELAEVEELKAGQTMDLQVRDGSNTAQSGFAFTPISGNITVTADGKLTANTQTTAPVEVSATKISTTVKQKFSVRNNTMVIKAGDVSLNAEDGYSVTAGNKVQLTAVDSVTKEPVAVTWNIPNSVFGYVSVNSTGLLDAKVATTNPATLTVTAAGYDTVTLPVTVRARSTFSKLEIEEGKLIVNQGCHLIAQDAAGNAVEDVKWEIVSGDAELEGNVLTVASTEVTSVRVKATHPEYEEKFATFASEVVIPTEVVVKLGENDFPAVLTMIVGDELNLNVQTVPSIISYPDYINVVSSDLDIVKIENGKLEAVGPGEATLTVSYGTARAILWTGKVKVKAATEIVLDETMPRELICGDPLELKAVLKNVAGETLETPVQWRLKEDENNKVIKNLVDLTANKLTAYPQSTYDFTVKLEAFIKGNNQVEVVEVPIHVLPRTTNIALKKGEEDISDKTIVLNVNDPNGITIDAAIRPSDAKKIVEWHIDGPANIYNPTRRNTSITLQPVSSQKTGTITVTAVAKDGTDVSRKTTVVFAKMADTVLITNAPEQMRGGANLQLRTNLDEDKTITDRRVKWSIVNRRADGTEVEGNNQYASVTADGLLDTNSVTERTKIYVRATLVANPNEKFTKEIELCPAVASIMIMQRIGIDSKGDPIRTNVKNVVDYSVKTITLDKIASPAGHIGSFVWDSSNKAVADFVPGTSELKLNGAGKTQITCTATDGSETRGVYNLEVVKTAGDVVINGATQLISGKNTILTATVYTDKTHAELAANQKVTWSVEDVYGNPTKAATINSRGRLYAKTVNYGTEVVVYATSVEDKLVVAPFHVMIQPKKEKTFAAFLEDDDGIEGDGRIIEAPLYMNPNETAVISGQWYIRDLGFDSAEDCSFYSSNRSVATIDPYDGTLKTLNRGGTTITVRATDPDSHNVYTAKFTLYVVNTVDHVAISKPDNMPDYVRSGSSMDFSATVWSNLIETVEADNKALSWGVYEETDEIDPVDGEAKLIATKAAYMTSGGRLVANSVTENTEVIVVAASVENPSASDRHPITIRPASAYTVTAGYENDEYEWVIPTTALSLEVQEGETPFGAELMARVYVSDPQNTSFDGETLEDPTVDWETSNKDIVKVVGGELVYTGKTGKVNVIPTYKAADGNTYRGNTVTLNISKLVDEDGIVVTKKYANQELYSGKSLRMYAEVDPDATTRRVTWSLEGTSASDYASINASTGLIRARKGLTTQETITVRATAVDGSGSYDELEVTIYPLATKVVIEDAPTTPIDKDEDTDIQLTAVLYVGDNADVANQEAVKWSSSRSSVVSVDQEGNLTPKRKGTATIKAAATDGSGKYATVKVTVK